MAENEITIAEADLAQFDPQQFAELIANASDEQISEVIHGPLRPLVLDQIFTRMADHVEPSQIQNLDAVVHFKILDRPAEHGGGYDHYEVIFAEGTCRASDNPERDPKVTIKVSGVHFLKLAANKASGPTLFLTGKLKLEGDVMLASRLTSFFRIPSAG
jgi:SCP-2 sterol transfer family protein